MSVALFVLSLAVILQSSQECSSANVNGFETQVEGTMDIKEAQHREFPYIVSVEGRWGDHKCGGTILNSEWVITAANCTAEQLGDIKVGSDNYQFGTTHIISDVRFPDKKHPFAKHEIALYKIDPPFKFTNTLKPANLPKHNQETPIGTRATVAGWGSNMVDGSRSPNLLKVDVTVVDMKECGRAFFLPNPPDGLVNICAIAPDYQKTPYKGDPGGPLIANDEIIGIASFKTLSCDKMFCPTVYIKVSKYVPWIMSNIGNR